ncbi:MAG: ABC-2 family transporter protein [Patescibacteria group bacterium]|nr:ABC-2 family transporter protein [Patescibacteria group bacterium]MCL5431818.1 ABC-2 family transporter protein [Patescibacteria group bacterium]
MKKYLTVFSVSWSNGFVYRLNFILWRVRSVIVILTVYFLWDAIFRNGGVIFGYDRQQILTYVFLTLVLRSFILGARSMDVGGDISDGTLANYLLKPINYHFFWLSRDLADKLLNIAFSIFEIFFLYFILQPPIYFQGNVLLLLVTVLTILIAVFLNFFMGFIASTTTFWTPGNTWGFWFIYLIIQELLGGVMFPLDILPKAAYNLLMLLPFPYLLYFPINLYLGKIPPIEIFRGLAVSGFWVLASYYVLVKFWQLGLKTFQAEGH